MMMNSEICELNEEFESEQSEELLNEIIEQANIKPVIRYISFYQERVIQEMTHEELKAMNSKQLNKMIMNEYVPDEFMRLYFDLDVKPSDMSNEEVPDTISKIFKTIDEKLKATFGAYSYGGYTTNEAVADEYDIRYFEQERKTLSLHIVFYESKVLHSDLHKVMNLLKRLPKAIINELMPGFDVSVYKEPGKRQLLRHVMTNKADDKHMNKTIEAWGTIAEGKTPDTQAVTPNGTEKLVTYDELIKAFDFLLQKVPPKPKQKQKQNEDKKEVTYHNEELERSLIEGLNHIEDPKVQIHTTQVGPVTEKLTTWYLLKSFYALSDDVRNEAIELLRNHPRLTEKASTTFDQKLEQVNNEIMDAEELPTIGQLINVIKFYAPEYYNNEYIGTIKQQKRNRFINSTYTKNEFINSVYKIKTLNELLNKLSLFVAITVNNSFIVKYRDEDENIKYRRLKLSDLDEVIGCTSFELEASEEDKLKMAANHKKVTDTITINLNKIFRTNIYYSNFAIFNNLVMLSNNKNDLQLFRPPAGEYKPDLIHKWIEFIKSRIVNPEAFIEMLDSHAYRFKHPFDFIEKFFVNYGTGRNGKSFLMACFASVYGDLCNVAARLNQVLSDNMNSWIGENLLINIEEVDSSAYVDKGLSNFIKTNTTKKSSFRGMYKETKGGRNWAILGMNTNQSDLFGLIRADGATRERLVILEWKTIDDNIEELNQKCHSFIDDPNFAYSLYHYLMNEHKEREGFSPCRYHGQDKTEYINKNKFTENKNSVEMWLTEDVDALFNKRYKVKGIIYKYCEEKTVTEYWRLYVKNNNIKYNFKLMNALKDLGFEYMPGARIGNEKFRIYRMEENKYNDFVNNKLNYGACDDEVGEMLD